jgi:hypothetical protein
LLTPAVERREETPWRTRREIGNRHIARGDKGNAAREQSWEEAGVTVAELSEQLLMSAKGIKASVDTLTAYRERMLTAIRIVTRSP